MCLVLWIFSRENWQFVHFDVWIFYLSKIKLVILWLVCVLNNLPNVTTQWFGTDFRGLFSATENDRNTFDLPSWYNKYKFNLFSFPFLSLQYDTSLVSVDINLVNNALMCKDLSYFINLCIPFAVKMMFLFIKVTGCMLPIKRKTNVFVR